MDKLTDNKEETYKDLVNRYSVALEDVYNILKKRDPQKEDINYFLKIAAEIKAKIKIIDPEYKHGDGI